jgi:hypothetical protein
VDHYGTEEILFLGPDEGTADVMDWASQRAKERGASFWKAFTTGKSRSLGGIPHVRLRPRSSRYALWLEDTSHALSKLPTGHVRNDDSLHPPVRRGHPQQAGH